MADSPAGPRLFQIRLACGDGVRTPMPMKEFVQRVKKITGETYHPNAISLLERDEQNWKLADINTLSRVDPLERGPRWLAFGDAPARPGDATASGAESYYGEPRGALSVQRAKPAAGVAGSKKKPPR